MNLLFIDIDSLRLIVVLRMKSSRIKKTITGIWNVKIFFIFISFGKIKIVNIKLLTLNQRSLLHIILLLLDQMNPFKPIEKYNKKSIFQK